MALLIEGNMPSCCAVCCDCNSTKDGNFCNRTGKRLSVNWQLYRPLDCPIRGEIPDKHGDLIDRNYLDEKASEYITPRDRRLGTFDFFEDLIADAPTVVEATE